MGGGDLEERALKQTQAKVGELTKRLELAELLLEKGYGDELARLKQSRGSVSQVTGQRYPVSVVRTVWRVPRSTA